MNYNSPAMAVDMRTYITADTQYGITYHFPFSHARLSGSIRRGTYFLHTDSPGEYLLQMGTIHL